MPDPSVSQSVASNHRVVLRFDDGIYVVRLIHPEGGCVESSQCGFCAADLGDPDSTRCYDCKDAAVEPCWVQGWFDNSTADELLHGEVELEIDCRWVGDHIEANIVSLVPQEATDV